MVPFVPRGVAPTAKAGDANAAIRLMKLKARECTLSSLCACSLGSHNLSRQNNGLKQQSRLDHTTRKALYDAASHAAYPPVPLSCKTGTRTQALSLQPPLMELRAP